MKVYFLGGVYESCFYVRCLIPMLANLWDGDRTSLERKPREPAKIVKGLESADVIVFHRPLDKKVYDLAVELKKAGKKIVMDNDDTYIKDCGVPTSMLGRLRKDLEDKLQIFDDNLKAFAKMADMVTVSTEFLAEEYKPYCDNVVVLPNCIDKRDWFRPKKNDGEKVRIGIIGSVASNQDYEPIIPLLDSLKDREDVQLVLFALPEKQEDNKLVVKMYNPEYEFWNKYKPEWHPFVQTKDYTFMLNNLKLDIALIPRHDSYFNRCKSNLKFLEASMCKIAVVAQGFEDGKSPYQGEEDAKHMLIANTVEEWKESVEKLIADKELRDTMGEDAFHYVTDKYDISKNKEKWIEAYNNLIK